LAGSVWVAGEKGCVLGDALGHRVRWGLIPYGTVGRAFCPLRRGVATRPVTPEKWAGS
jgi:hypothetical protein